MSQIRNVLALALLLAMASCGGQSGTDAQQRLVAVPGAPVAAPAKPGVWTEQAGAALVGAGQAHLPILADFTGSDWCVACQMLKREVFDTPAFKAWATTHVILLELDFPAQAAQSAEIAAQNRDLNDRFAIDGYPTIVAFDGEGHKLGMLQGYVPNTGPERWIAEFSKLLGHPAP